MSEQQQGPTLTAERQADGSYVVTNLNEREQRDRARNQQREQSKNEDQARRDQARQQKRDRKQQSQQDKARPSTAVQAPKPGQSVKPDKSREKQLAASYKDFKNRHDLAYKSASKVKGATQKTARAGVTLARTEVARELADGHRMEHAASMAERGAHQSA